jgi:hypothetical protein
MPSTSEKQKRTMAAAAHDPGFAKKVGIPQAVAKEFNHADHLRELHRAAKSAPTMRTSTGGKPRSGY